jgi:hypothetical protein
LLFFAIFTLLILAIALPSDTWGKGQKSSTAHG